MAVSFVQENNGTTGTGTPSSVNATLPSGTTSGNTLILIVNCDATVNTPSGFTLDRQSVANCGLYIYRKATSNGETSWTVTPTSAASTVWYVAEISGLTASPLDRVASQTGGSSSSASTGTTATTTQDDELAIGAWGASRTGSTAATWSSHTNGYSERLADVVTNKGSGTNVGLSVATLILTTTQTTSSTATAAASQFWATAVATYKIDAAAPVDKAGADTGSGAEAATLLATSAGSDAGSGSEVASLSGGKTASDTGSGVEDTSLVAPLPGSIFVTRS